MDLKLKRSFLVASVGFFFVFLLVLTSQNAAKAQFSDFAPKSSAGLINFSDSKNWLDGIVELSVEELEAEDIQVQLSGTPSGDSLYIGTMTETSPSNWSLDWDTGALPNGRFYLFLLVRTSGQVYVTEGTEVRIKNSISRISFSSVKEALRRSTRDMPENFRVALDAKLQNIENKFEREKEVVKGASDFTNERITKRNEEIVNIVFSYLENNISVREESLSPDSLYEKEARANFISELSRAANILIERAMQVLADQAPTRQEKYLVDRISYELKREIQKERGELLRKSDQQDFEDFDQKALEAILEDVEARKGVISRRVTQHYLENSRLGVGYGNFLNDLDRDFLYNDEELEYGTNMLSPDSDGDGVRDYFEIVNGFDPLDSSDVSLATLGDPRDQGQVGASEHRIEQVRSVVLEKKGSSGLQITGKAPPGSFNLVYIYSERPVVVSVRADNSGSWRYVYDRPLAEGEHQVYVAEVNNKGELINRSPAFGFVKQSAAISAEEGQDQAPSPKGREGIVRRRPSSRLFGFYALGTFIIITTAAVLGLVVIGFITKKRIEQNFNSGQNE